MRRFAKLPPAYRAVLALRYNEHLKFREIAATLGEPIDTVKSKHREGTRVAPQRPLFLDWL